MATILTPSNITADNIACGQYKFPATQNASSDVNTLDDYDEYTSPSTACTGALTVNASYKVTKIGRVVTLYLPPITGTATNSTQFGVEPPVPVRFRPANIVASASAYIAINSAGVSTPGLIQIDTSGNIKVYREGIATVGYGTAAGTGLSNAASVSWTI